MRDKVLADVSIVRTAGRSVTSAVQEAVELAGGIGRFVRPGATVLIKPNLTLAAAPQTGGTTPVDFVAALVGVVRSARAGRILVCEGAGVEVSTMEAFENLGYLEMADRLGVELCDCDTAARVPVKLPGGLYQDTYYLPRAFTECDVYISAPVMKNHAHSGLTIALKNTFGLLEDTAKMEVHRADSLEQCLVDLARIRAPGLAVVDARLGSEGIAGGTDFEHPTYPGLIVAGGDALAVESVCCRIMGQNPRIRYLAWAEGFGIGTTNIDYVNVRGASIAEAEHRFMSPREHLCQSLRRVNLIDGASCTGCRALVEGGLTRYGEKGVVKEVTMAYGPCVGRDDLDRDRNPAGPTVLAGDCIPEDLRGAGVWLPGCPPSRKEFDRLLEELDISCRICEQSLDAALRAVRERSAGGEDLLRDIRAVAAGRELFRGPANDGGLDKPVVVVGDCERRYCSIHRNRVRKVIGAEGLDRVWWVPGCPPAPEDIARAIQERRCGATGL